MTLPHDHGLINNVVEQTGESREVVLNQLALLASKSSRWEQYTRSVRLALESMRDALNIDPQA